MTPLLAKTQAAKSPKLELNLVFSVIADQRTLDLQAANPEQQSAWVKGLKSRFRQYVKTYTKEEVLPPELSKLLKVYPEKFRSSQCELRSSVEQLQAMATFGDTFEAAATKAQGVGQSRQACENCGSGLLEGATSCRMCGTVPSANPKMTHITLDIVEEQHGVSIS